MCEKAIMITTTVTLPKGAFGVGSGDATYSDTLYTKFDTRTIVDPDGNVSVIRYDMEMKTDDEGNEISTVVLSKRK